MPKGHNGVCIPTAYGSSDAFFHISRQFIDSILSSWLEYRRGKMTSGEAGGNGVNAAGAVVEVSASGSGAATRKAFIITGAVHWALKDMSLAQGAYTLKYNIMEEEAEIVSLSFRTDGGSSCIGPTRSYRSCNIQNCPVGSRDFRAEQCAEFDGMEFQGKRYKWLPYYGAPNKCELNCIPKGENFYYRHKEAVTDGTPCEPGKRDVCVEGACQAVGCDNMLDSFKKEDKCLQCGGNGRACFEVKGLFDVPNLPKGYNPIFIIPMGATSIQIKEATPTRNFLGSRARSSPWYTPELWAMKWVGRRLECRWRKSRDESDRTHFQAHYRAYAVVVRATKKKFFPTSIASSQCRPAELFRVVHGLVQPGLKKDPVPPSMAHCDDFAQHFKEKIAQIRHKLDSTSDSDPLGEVPMTPSGQILLDEFQLLRPDDVDKVLGLVCPTTCLLEPCPLWMPTKAKHGIVAWILEVIITSLRDGRVPAPLKEAVVRPVLKKASLDP
ncbi:Papilin [Varanus komodoensis]|nr:Papilin [Varanus komodoensis]